MKEQFVKVPNTDMESDGLNRKDKLVYAYLKMHYNEQDKYSFPSIDLIVKESGISKPTVIKCIKNLQDAKYIRIEKVGKQNHYFFNEVNGFEIYSFEFLKDKTLSREDKEYIIVLQQHMYKDKDLGIGKITYSEIDIAKILDVDMRTLKKYETHLQERERPIMTIIPTQKKDPITGLMLQERIFDFDAYNNILALKFKEIDSKLDDKVSKEDFEKLVKIVNKITKQKDIEDVEYVRV